MIIPALFTSTRNPAGEGGREGRREGGKEGGRERATLANTQRARAHRLYKEE
jgi:hypothetical protein